MAWRAPSRRLPLSGIGPANDIPIAQRRVARRQAEHFFERRMPVKAAIVAKDEFVEICIDVLATQAGGVAKPSGDGTAVATLLRARRSFIVSAPSARTFSFGGAEAGSGCDARRLSTGQSIRAWRTLFGRQMKRNAGRTRYPIAALRAAWAGAHAGFSDSGPPLAISSDTRRRRFLHRRLFDRNSARSKRPARLRCRRLASRAEPVASDL